MERLWVVMGGTGEYSDRCEWPVRAYRDKSRAELEVSRLSEEAKAFEARVPYDYGSGRCAEVMAHGKKVGDPGFASDYTGTSYFYYEVELVNG